MGLIALLKHQYARLSQGSFARNVMVMFVGTALGQLVSVVLSPVLTRIYTPESFGILGNFTAVIGILSVLASLRYELALPLAKNDSEAANLLAVCGVALAVTVSLGMLVVMAIPAAQFAAMGVPRLAPYRFLMPLGFLCIGAYQVLVYYATQQSNYSIIARTKISQGAAGPLSQIGFGLLGFETVGLLAGFVIGQTTGCTVLFTKLVLAPKKAVRHISWPAMKYMAGRFRRFPLVSAWSGLINAAGAGLLLVVIPMMYSNVIAGYIFLTDRIVGRPLLLISTSILQVYIGEASKSISNDPEAVRRRFLQLALQQFCIVATWLLVVNLVAPYVFPYVFGEQWSAAVPYLQVLSVAYLPQMIMHALVHTLQILEKHNLSAAWEAGRLIAVVGSFVVSHLLGFDAWHALLLYSLCQAASQLVLFVLMYRSIQSLQKTAVVE